jgi:hypothetical protein
MKNHTAIISNVNQNETIVDEKMCRANSTDIVGGARALY